MNRETEAITEFVETVLAGTPLPTLLALNAVPSIRPYLRDSLNLAQEWFSCFFGSLLPKVPMSSKIYTK